MAPSNSYDDYILPAETSSSIKGTPSQNEMHEYMFHMLFPEYFYERPITIADEWRIVDGHHINQAQYQVADTGKTDDSNWPDITLKRGWRMIWNSVRRMEEIL